VALPIADAYSTLKKVGMPASSNAIEKLSCRIHTTLSKGQGCLDDDAYQSMAFQLNKDLVNHLVNHMQL